MKSNTKQFADNGRYVVPRFNGKPGKSFSGWHEAVGYTNKVHGLGYAGIISWVENKHRVTIN